MKKTIKLTESSLIKLIKNLVNEQLTSPTTGGSSTGKPTGQNQTVGPPKDSEIQKLIDKSFNFPFPLNLYSVPEGKFLYQVKVLNLRWKPNTSNSLMYGDVQIEGNRNMNDFTGELVVNPCDEYEKIYINGEWENNGKYNQQSRYFKNDKFSQDLKNKLCIESQYNDSEINRRYVPAAPGGYGSVPRKNQPNDYV